MKLTDSLSRQLCSLPDDDPVTVYSCGPTVYDYPHLGNWYAFLRWDLLVRSLEASGRQVKWVMNITDVGHLVSDGDEGEDKLAAKAKVAKKTAWEIAAFYEDYFKEGLGRLHFRLPDHLPRATEHIETQIEIVKKLQKAGVTYLIDDGLYFDTSKKEDYGKLVRLDEIDLLPGKRIKNSQKRQANDFALWKLTPAKTKRDMEWDSPWGRGFPGWHLECSAMAAQYLGPTVTIHAGGIDHIPVHHTNEIAQSEVAFGQPLAKIWLHSNFILINGQKMSKSLGNCWLLEDIEKNGWSLPEFKLVVLASRYQTEANFTWEAFPAARMRYQQLRSLAALKYQLGVNYKTFDLQTITDQILGDLLDDLNSPQALSRLDQFLDTVIGRPFPKNQAKQLEEFLNKIEAFFGLGLLSTPDLSQDLKDLLAKRRVAREASDWAQSDRLRNELAQRQVLVQDTPSGQIWSWL